MSLTYDNIRRINMNVISENKKCLNSNEGFSDKLEKIQVNTIPVTSAEDFWKLALDINSSSYHISFFIYAFNNKMKVFNLIKSHINNTQNIILKCKLIFLYDDFESNNSLSLRKNEAYKYLTNDTNNINPENLKLHKIIKKVNYKLSMGLIKKDNFLFLTIKLKDNLTGNLKSIGNMKFNIENLNKKSPDDTVNSLSEIIFGTSDFLIHIIKDIPYKDKIFSYNNKNIIINNKDLIPINELNIKEVQKFFSFIISTIYQEYFTY